MNINFKKGKYLILFLFVSILMMPTAYAETENEKHMRLCIDKTVHEVANAYCSTSNSKPVFKISGTKNLSWVKNAADYRNVKIEKVNKGKCTEKELNAQVKNKQQNDSAKSTCTVGLNRVKSACEDRCETAMESCSGGTSAKKTTFCKNSCSENAFETKSCKMYSKGLEKIDQDACVKQCTNKGNVTTSDPGGPHTGATPTANNGNGNGLDMECKRVCANYDKYRAKGGKCVIDGVDDSEYLRTVMINAIVTGEGNNRIKVVGDCSKTCSSCVVSKITNAFKNTKNVSYKNKKGISYEEASSYAGAGCTSSCQKKYDGVFKIGQYCNNTLPGELKYTKEERETECETVAKNAIESIKKKHDIGDKTSSNDKDKPSYEKIDKVGCEMLSDELLELLADIYHLIRGVAIVAVVILGIMDFIKATASN
ncbi:MAG: hypothetical protein KH135_06350, partial [Firmicutes bacterium]|nr:hypothetical protein [Bacillota bacterium]